MMLDTLLQRLRETGSVSFAVRTRPHAPETRLRGILDDGSVKVDVTAPAEDGKANAELRAFLAGAFGVPVANVDIVAGQAGRRKVIKVIL